MTPTLAAPVSPSISAEAQQGRRASREIPPGLATLKASAGRKTVAMVLTHLRAEARIAGLVAEITLLLTFHNPHRRELEGELLFPLPPGATLCGFGLDVEGKIVDASLVEKHKARRVFEEEVNRPEIIDPGLAEHVRGNIFRTRVYPLPPRGTRQVKLQYVCGLDVMGGNALLDLPLAGSENQTPLQSLCVRVEVTGGSRPLAEGNNWDDFGFTENAGTHTAELTQHDVMPRRLRIVLPEIPQPWVQVQATPAGEQYFAIHILAPDDAADESAKRLPVAGAAVRLAWDVSLSRAMSQTTGEWEVLQRVLDRLGDVDVELVAFALEAQPAHQFQIRGGDASALLNFLRALPCDGATGRRALQQAAMADAGPFAFTLLFSDGMTPFDDTIAALHAFPSAAPIFAITGSPTADHGLLQNLCENTGGVFLDLTRVDIESAADSVGKIPLAFLSAVTLEGNVEDLVPAGPQAVHGVFTATGRLPGERAVLRLNFGYRTGTETDSPVRSVTCNIDRTFAVGNVTPRLWAQQKVAQINATAGKNAQHDPRLLELGRKFGLVTPGASLLVLETLQQHLEYEIEPAESRTELRCQYLNALARRQSQAPQEEAAPSRGATRQERADLLRFYARLRLGPDVDVEWLIDRTENRTSAELVEMIDSASFFASSRGAAKVETADLLKAGWFLNSPRESPVKLAWRARLAWWKADYSSKKKRKPRGRSGTPFYSKAGYRRGLRASFGEDDLGGVDMALDATTTTRDRSASFLGELSAEIDTNSNSIAPARLPRVRAPRQPVPNFASEREALAEYFKQRAHRANDANLYADWGAHFLKRGWRQAGRGMLSNLAETGMDNVENLRLMAYLAEAAGEDALAEQAYEVVLALRPEEPQSLRDLALVLERRGKITRAAHLLAAVAAGKWAARFQGIEATALAELTALAARHRSSNNAPTAGEVLPDLSAELGPSTGLTPDDLSESLPSDLRVVLDWNCAQTGMSLKVLEPGGEWCDVASPWGSPAGDITQIGGQIQGSSGDSFGPEEYLLRRAAPGVYRFHVHFYSAPQRRLATPAAIKLTLFRNFGRDSEQRNVIVLRRLRREPPALYRESELGCGLVALSMILLIAGFAFLPTIHWVLELGLAGCLGGIAWVNLGSFLRRRYERKNEFEVANLTID